MNRLRNLLIVGDLVVFLTVMMLGFALGFYVIGPFFEKLFTH